MAKYIPMLLMTGLITVSVSSSACVNVQPDMVENIASGLSIGGGGTLVKTSARAIKSNDFKNIYFIAAEIQGQGMESKGEIGLWASNSIEAGKGMLLSVNSLAIEFSVWPNGKKSQARLSQFDHGGQEAINCVKKAQDA